MNYLDVANSGLMFALCLVPVCVIVLQALRFMAMAWKQGLEIGMDKEKLKKCIAERPVLLLAPGKSLKTNQERIMELLEADDYFVASVNFIPPDPAVDMMFVSNMKRFRSMEELGKAGRHRFGYPAPGGCLPRQCAAADPHIGSGTW